MKDAPFFHFFTQRWLAGTVGMTAEERGAYIHLLAHQWEDDGLPDNTGRLLAIAACQPAALLAVLEKFPVSADGKRRNARLESVRTEQRSRIQKSRDPVLLEKEPRRERVKPDDGMAGMIYAAYPKRVGRPDAIRKINAALSSPPLGKDSATWPVDLLALTHRYAAIRKGEPPKFTPNPATWFHQRRFEDDPATWKSDDKGTGSTRGIVTWEAPRLVAVPDSERVSPTDFQSAKEALTTRPA